MKNEANSHRGQVVTLVSVIIFLMGASLIIVSFFVVEPWKTILSGVGGFLIISVLMPYAYEVTLKARDTEERIVELKRILDEKIDQSLSGSFRRGLVSFDAEINFTKLFNELNNGDVLWWLDTYAPDHKRFIEHLQEALNRGVIVNFMVLHPNSDNCRYRAGEIVDGIYDYDRFSAELRRFWEDVKSCKPPANSGGKVNMCLYSDLPCIPMYLVSRAEHPIYAYTSFYLRKPTGYRFPHIRWEKGEMLSHFYDYIKFKWERNNCNTEM